MNPTYPVICFGELLFDILPSGEMPGGAPMNVAYHLKKAGIETALITKLGADERGHKLIDLLSSNHITTRFVQKDVQHATGVVYANVSDKHEVSYDIVFPSAWDFIEWNEETDDAVGASNVFIFGSLSSRSETSRSTLYRLLESAQTKLCDINLRFPFADRSHVEYLLKQSDIVKMNESELQLICAWYADYVDQNDQIRFLQDHFRLDSLIVTLGAEGAVVDESGNIFRHPGFKVDVADTIGSGDAFLAGYLSQTLQGASAEKALDYAAALGAFIATQHGACPAYTPAYVLTISNQLTT